MSVAEGLIVLSIVLGEYYFGIRQSRYCDQYQDWLRQFLRFVDIATVTQAITDVYSEIRLDSKRFGTPIPSNDAWLAALAVQHTVPVYNNDIHFDYASRMRCIAF